MRFLLLFAFVFSSLNAFSQSESPLRSGPMLGYIEQMEANIWLQTKKSSSIKIQYWNAETPDVKLQTQAVKSSPEHSFVLTIKLKHLSPGATYIYEIVADGKKVKTPWVLKFKTQTLYQFRTDPPNFSFALGSCAYVNDEPYDRPGKAYGAEYEIFGTIRKQNPDLMLWLGDNIYLREPEFFSRARMDYRYTHTRELKEMQELLAASVNLATWDDHDYGPNDSDRSYRNKQDALDMFKRYWLNPQYGTEQAAGVFGRYQYNDVEFFLMDDRYHRAPNASTDSAKAYWGAAQLEWLKDALLNSNATFKFIVNGNQIINAASKHEAFAAGYKVEYTQFMTWLTASKISGVVLLSGDRHHTELLKLDRQNSYPVYEFTSSPLTSGLHSDLEEETENPLRVPKTLVSTVRNFGVIRVEGNRNNRTLILQTFDAKGELLWDQRIDASQLKAQ